jgi:hypothetical protein
VNCVVEESIVVTFQQFILLERKPQAEKKNDNNKYIYTTERHGLVMLLLVGRVHWSKIARLSSVLVALSQRLKLLIAFECWYSQQWEIRRKERLIRAPTTACTAGGGARRGSTTSLSYY